MPDPSSLNGNAMTASALTKFTWFPKLPPELRSKIWRDVARVPRVVRLHESENYDPLAEDEDQFTYHLALSAWRAPSVLHATREARAEARRYLKKHHFEPSVLDLNWSGRLRPYIWFNFNIDIILFGPDMKNSTVNSFLDDYPKVKNIALHITPTEYGIERETEYTASGVDDINLHLVKEVNFVMSTDLWADKIEHGNVTVAPAKRMGRFKSAFDLERWDTLVDTEEWIQYICEDGKIIMRYINLIPYDSTDDKVYEIQAAGPLIMRQLYSERDGTSEIIEEVETASGCKISTTPRLDHLGEPRDKVELGLHGTREQIRRCKTKLLEQLLGTFQWGSIRLPDLTCNMGVISPTTMDDEEAYKSGEDTETDNTSEDGHGSEERDLRRYSHNERYEYREDYHGDGYGGEEREIRPYNRDDGWQENREEGHGDRHYAINRYHENRFGDQYHAEDESYEDGDSDEFYEITREEFYGETGAHYDSFFDDEQEEEYEDFNQDDEDDKPQLNEFVDELIYKDACNEEDEEQHNSTYGDTDSDVGSYGQQKTDEENIEEEDSHQGSFSDEDTDVDSLIGDDDSEENEDYD